MRWAVPLCVLVGILGAHPLLAQVGAEEGERVYVKHDEKDWSDDAQRWALGLGFGLVNIDEEAFTDDVEPYFAINFRIALAGRSKRGWAHREFGMRGYLEPELGYWEKSEAGDSLEDILLGLNLVGVTPVGSAAEFFLGGGLGLHFVDGEVRRAGVAVDRSQESIGANVHFGVDVFVSNQVSLFAAGRFDLVEDRDDLEAKAYAGVRFHF